MFIAFFQLILRCCSLKNSLEELLISDFSEVGLNNFRLPQENTSFGVFGNERSPTCNLVKQPFFQTVIQQNRRITSLLITFWYKGDDQWLTSAFEQSLVLGGAIRHKTLFLIKEIARTMTRSKINVVTKLLMGSNFIGLLICSIADAMWK